MGHDCKIPPTASTKRFTWRCPDCKKAWEFDPNKKTTGLLGWLFDERTRDGKKARLWQ